VRVPVRNSFARRCGLVGHALGYPLDFCIS
jgi:hypothetical protein